MKSVRIGSVGTKKSIDSAIIMESLIANISNSDVWIPQLPQWICSRLFHLSPMGIGTSKVESFTSYILRLALEHGVLLSTLASKEILPLLKQTHTYSNTNTPGSYQLTASWWRECSVALNGLTPSAEDWHQVLKKLTLRTDLEYLTLIRWKNILSWRGLLRRNLAWCPECLESARTQCQSIYYHLLWSFEVIKVCVSHKRLLQFSCPYLDCGRELTVLAPHAQPGYCHYCHRWLGISQESNQTPLSDSEWIYQQSIVHSVGEMIAVTPELKDYPRREIISSTIDTYICVNLDNNVSEFSRQLGVSKRTATELRRGTQLPQLRTLLNICALLDTTPRAMFINKVEGSKTEDTLQIPKLGIAVLDYEIQPPRVFDKDYVYDHLEGVLKDNSYPPPTMTKVANELNFDASFLHNHFPDLCSKISERYLQYRAEKKAHRIANLCGRVRRKILELHRRGELPIRHRLSQIFHKVIQTVPEISDTYCQTMHELGYPQSYWLVCVVTTS